MQVDNVGVKASGKTVFADSYCHQKVQAALGGRSNSRLIISAAGGWLTRAASDDDNDTRKGGSISSRHLPYQRAGFGSAVRRQIGPRGIRRAAGAADFLAGRTIAAGEGVC